MAKTMSMKFYIYTLFILLMKLYVLMSFSLPAYASRSSLQLTEDVKKVISTNEQNELKQCLEWFDERKLANIESGITRPINSQMFGNALCLDGEFEAELPETVKKAVAGLKQEQSALLVVRSFGGNTESALTLAEMLLEHQVRIVVVDFCASSCANYLLSVADSRIVLDDSLVLFHGGVHLDLLDEVERQLKNQEPALPDEQLYASLFHIRQDFLKQIQRQEQLLEQNKIAKHLFRWMALYPKMSKEDQQKHCPDNSSMITYSPEALANFDLTFSYYAGPRSQREVDELLKRWDISARMCYWN